MLTFSPYFIHEGYSNNVPDGHNFDTRCVQLLIYKQGCTSYIHQCSSCKCWGICSSAAEESAVVAYGSESICNVIDVFNEPNAVISKDRVLGHVLEEF
jgi:hypothetical protein